MTVFVVATDSVHTSATLCDYLSDRLAERDTVYGIAVLNPSATPDGRRDAEDALNALRVRLSASTTVETDLRADGPPAETVRSVALDVDADELVVGTPRPASEPADSGGDDAGGGLDGESLVRLLSGSPCPAVVVPCSG